MMLSPLVANLNLAAAVGADDDDNGDDDDDDDDDDEFLMRHMHTHVVCVMLIRPYCSMARVGQAIVLLYPP